MNYKSLLLFIHSISCICFFISSCKESRPKESFKENVDSQGHYHGIQYSVADSLENGLTFTLTSIDTIISEKSEGIEVNFKVNSNRSLWTDLKNQGYDAVYISLSCVGGKPCSSPRNFYSEKYLSMHDEFMLSREGDKFLTYTFPFRSLEMKKGKNEVSIILEALPVRFKSDSLKSDLKEVDIIASRAIASKKITLHVNAPELVASSIEVLKFKINTKVCDPSKYDFALGGTGYPDLFWDVQCGDEYIYHSPQEKNSLQYSTAYHSPEFLCSKNDKVIIRVVDFDKGPFNTQHDVIETWSGTINELSAEKPETLSFGNLEYLIVRKKLPNTVADKHRKNK